MGLVGGLAWSTMLSGAEQFSIADSTFQDWSAHKVQTTLADGSVLTEYVAQSYAAAQVTKRLDVSFIPRFGCTPITSFLVIVKEDALSKPYSTQALNFDIDGKLYGFAVLLDKQATSERYTLNASSEGQSSFRRVLDSGSRASVSIVGYGDSELVGVVGSEPEIPAVSEGSTESVSTTRFSLLGSRKAASVAQAHCLAHEPIPFESD